MGVLSVVTESHFCTILIESQNSKKVSAFCTMNQTQDKEYLFERMPVPGAVMQLSLPIVISSLVTILYNLADTFLWVC